MKISELMQKYKTYSSITVEEQSDGTFKGTCYLRETGKRKYFKLKNLEDYPEYLDQFKPRISNETQLYLCLYQTKHPKFHKFYLNIYLLLKNHLH